MSHHRRYLSFCAGVETNLHRSYPVHMVVLRGGILTLKDSDPAHPARPASPDDLIERAQSLEWEYFVDEMLANDAGLQDIDAEKRQAQLQQVRAMNYAGLASYRRQLPQEVQKLFEDLPRGWDRQIVHAAQRLVDRRTAFLLPEYESDIPAGHCSIEAFSSHLYDSLQSGNNTIGILRIAGRGKAIEPSIHQEVMHNLLMSTSGVPLSVFRSERQGPSLIEGNTGTGKSLGARQVARMLKMPFVALNLAAVTEDLLESRIRGHKKGVFTGATNDSPGIFELAHNGVLFLDELQSASLPAQTQLLDLLNAVSDDVIVSRMGEEKMPKQLKVKLILAVNRPLAELLEEGKLRYDLFHRLRNVVRLPSLHSRVRGRAMQTAAGQTLAGPDTDEPHNVPESGLQFARALLTLYRWRWQQHVNIDDLLGKGREIALPQPFLRITNDALASICHFDWPGNFRQFERFCHDLFDNAQIQADDEISQYLVETQLREERAREGLGRDLSPTRPVSLEQDKLEKVQRILESQDFVIARCLDKLTPYKLKSRAALRAYLLNNEPMLKREVREQSAVMAFLRGKSGKTS